MKKLGNRGISAFEVLLILAIVGVIGGVGWFVLNSKDDTNKTYESTSQSKASTTPAVTTYKLDEFDVQFTLPEELSGLSHKVVELQDERGRPEDVIYLYDKNLAAASKKCADAALQEYDKESTNFASLTRGEGTFKEGGAFSTAELLKQLSGFYITISFPNGSACAAENHNLMQKMSVAVTDSREVFEKAFRTTASEIKQ